MHKLNHGLSRNNITISCIYLFLTPNSQSVFHSGVLLNIHSFIRVETNRVKKERYLMTQDNIQIFDKNFFFKFRIRQMKVTETNK